ncbi:MAG: PIN domain nuclease [Anaerolineaceae bacterium]|nr:PIN domain nuclease [Anaerolineaceae bacterium]
MSAILLSRIIGAIAFGLIGFFSGTPIHDYLISFWVTYPFRDGTTVIICVVLFAIIGYIITPWISVKPVQSIAKKMSKSSPRALLSALVGLILGLIISALLAYPISLLPDPLGQILPLVMVVVWSYLGVSLFYARGEEFSNVFHNFSNRFSSKGSKTQVEGEYRILVDTSAIIDGRIADIVKTGFLHGTLIVPRFVLNELQYVSDSADSLRRQRGRRGMDILAELQQNEDIPVVISDIDVEGVREVDDRLVVLARQMRCPILTNDYNLNRIAELQGVKVLNINDLANAVKVILLPGESFKVHIIQEGKEYNQGVGFMDDGTMVVVEDGQQYMNKEVTVTVTKVLQTSAGRMIFAKPENE